MQNQGFKVHKASVQTAKGGTLKKNGRYADPQISREDVARLNTTAAAKAAGLLPDTGSWLTRNESADTLRMSVTTISNYEKAGKLHPQYAYRTDSRGIEHRVAVYDPKELTKLRREGREPTLRDPGEIAARSFELFNQGQGEREVVIELRVVPEHARQLLESWRDAGGTDTTLAITDTHRAALEQIVGPFSTVETLVERVKELTTRDLDA